MLKKVANLFIISGVLLLITVLAIKGFTYYKQQQLIASYQNVSFDELNEQDGTTNLEHTGQATSQLAVGMLRMDQIDLNVPIVEGTSTEDLRYAVGHFPESGRLGKKGENFAIAGHRSYTFGEFFNRLDEIEEKDTFFIETADGKYEYRVYDKQIVKPDAVEVLEPVDGKSTVTLITCHPAHSSKERLIVFAEKIEKK
ncbi:class D sortase [Massilibacterium senegalense]|uniref:class D sortase n=1 Tax=Massilibacterium senegalense TaxID=1632858 RepID=UPI0007819080|nr:class D sortase [Massilibacterium senegalense]